MLFRSYAGTKGGVIAFTKSLARETARYKLNINCVCPGPTDTPLLMSTPEKQREALIRAIPFRRFAKPSEVAETELALQDVKLWNPGFSTASAGKMTPMGVQCRKGHGTLHVIVLAGVAPEWVSESCEPTSAALLIADRILSAQSKHKLPPTLASVKIARPASINHRASDLTPGAAIVGAGLGTERRQLGFSTIVDLQEVARASYQQGRDKAIADAVVRRVVKKGTVVAAKAVTNQSSDWKVDLAMSAVGVLWEALEKPDTRS